MKKNTKLFFMILLVGLFSTANTAEKKHHDHVKAHHSHIKEVNAFLKKVFEDNHDHVKMISHEDFKNFAEQQTPRATIVSCSDSRVQTTAFHSSPVNDLFVVRNIGNQVITTEGSVQYGIDHLHTPVLMIIGHSNCGAVKAALDNYSKEDHSIRKELDHLRFSKGTNVNTGVIENVHRQVSYAMENFKQKVANKKLVIIGVVYDFRDDFHHGHGRLILINLNGEKNIDRIKHSEYLKNIKNVSIGEFIE